jgi:TPR repeat protein
MKKQLSLLLTGLLPLAAVARPSSPRGESAQWLAEQRHFLECLAVVYAPALWLSYNGSLYFAVRNEAQARQLAEMKTARSQYVALTNRLTRYQIAKAVLSDSGVAETWQRKLLLPYSETNQNLTPTLERPMRFLASYELLEAMPGGDAVIAGEGTTNFVLLFGRGAADTFHTNAVLVHEGQKAYVTPSRERIRIPAFTDASLTAEEIAVLNQVAVAFRNQAAGIRIAAAKPRAADDLKADFQGYQARAKDSSPYMEYMLAKCYLEGLGTETNRELGLEWMNRAARNGSGDAKTYLENPKSNP